MVQIPGQAERDITLVVGATGFLGTEVVRQLRSNGRRVRAVVRATVDEAKRDILKQLATDIVESDLKDPTSLLKACDGVSSIISTATAMTSRQPGDTIATVDEKGQIALLNAAAERGVEHFVFISFPPNQFDYALQRAKRTVESELTKRRLSYTVLRSAPFMEVWFSPALGFDPLGQTMPSRVGRVQLWGTGENPSNWISIFDVARFASAASSGGSFKNKTIDLAGTDTVSPLQVVEIFRKLTGRRVDIDCVPVAALESQMMGSQDSVAQARVASALVVAAGQKLDNEQASRLLPGPFRSVQEWAGRQVELVSNLLSSETKSAISETHHQ